MALLQQFERVLVRYIQAPWFLAQDAVFDVIADLCKRSYCWLHEQSFVVQHSVVRYPLTPLEHTHINSIVAAAIDGKPLIQGTDFELDHDHIRLYKTMTGHLKVVLSLYPTSQSVELDNDLFDRYRNAICQGAAADLGQHEKAEWALSKSQIDRYQRAFEDGCSDAVQFSLNKASRLFESQTKHQFF